MQAWRKSPTDLGLLFAPIFFYFHRSKIDFSPPKDTNYRKGKFSKTIYWLLATERIRTRDRVQNSFGFFIFFQKNFKKFYFGISKHAHFSFERIWTRETQKNFYFNLDAFRVWKDSNPRIAKIYLLKTKKSHDSRDRGISFEKLFKKFL